MGVLLYRQIINLMLRIFKKQIGFIFLVLFLASPLYAKSKPEVREPITATVIKVVDGDTLKIRYSGQEESVRLIGIDTPESKANKKAKSDAEKSKSDVKTITSMGKEAVRFTAGLVKPGDEIIIEFDVRQRDQYGRLLGYVYLFNGKMLNEVIIKAGYANVMTYPPNVRYQEKFLNAYRESRESKRGLWR